jgi:dienelactone hydrolase
MNTNLNEKSDIGNMFKVLKQYIEYNEQCNLREYSYLEGKWADFEQWKSIARAKVFELLNYFPETAQLEAAILNVTDKGEYRQEEIEFNTAKNIRVQGSLLIPNTNEKNYPAIIALHDHGGFYYYGREKIIEGVNEPEILRNFKSEAYCGRSWATEIVKRGYIVLCIDAFYFGSRKIDLVAISDEIKGRCPYKIDEKDYDKNDYIYKYNKNCGYLESLLVKHILLSGTTWPGMLFHDDRKCIDYLYTRKEVNKEKIGCCGLSIGGFRSVHLAALDSRIKCSVIAGWMTTYNSLLYNRLRDHTYMIYIPGLTNYLDLPDIMSMTVPNPVFIQQCTKDMLFNYEGMYKSCQIIEKVYDKLGYNEKCRYEFYDNKHEFNLNMQEDAFNWFDKWFK